MDDVAPSQRNGRTRFGTTGGRTGDVWSACIATGASTLEPTSRLAFRAMAATRLHEEDVARQGATTRGSCGGCSCTCGRTARSSPARSCCLMIEGLLQLVGPLLTQRVIDVALPAHDVGARVARRRCCSRRRSSLAFGCSYGETMLTGLLGQRVMRDLRQQLFAHVQRLPIAFFDRNPVGRLVTRVTSRRRIAERAVHGGRRRRAGRPVHAARDQRR